jgi:hypothetical protein
MTHPKETLSFPCLCSFQYISAFVSTESARTTPSCDYPATATAYTVFENEPADAVSLLPAVCVSMMLDVNSAEKATQTCVVGSPNTADVTKFAWSRRLNYFHRIFRMIPRKARLKRRKTESNQPYLRSR